MENKYLLLLAFDALLTELDDTYVGVPEEKQDLLRSKVFESYGLTVTSNSEDIIKMTRLLIQDVKKYRDDIIADL